MEQNDLEGLQLLPFSKIIKLAKQAGVDFGKGYPYNRLRYYTKTELLPKAQRKSFGGPPEGAYPSWVVDKLVEIDKNLKAGKSIQSIVREEREKSIVLPVNLESVVLTNFNNQGSDRYQNEPQPNYEETGQNNPSKILPSLIVATLLLLIISSLYFTAYRLPFTHDTLKSFNNSIASLVNSSRDGKFIPESPNQALKNIGEVLARNTAPFLKINVGTAISGLLTASGGIETGGADANLGIGELTASNVIYDIVAGDNVTLTGGQIKTISASGATGVGSVTGTAGRITSTG
ncbi:hypothetical protein IID23_04065, partial [Patescibacteria group bacterium]|nr:hypothetical protein [Patescibacteria group bacterium]